MLWCKIFVLKECILSLASLHTVVRVLALGCSPPLLDWGYLTFSRCKYSKHAFLNQGCPWEHARQGPQLPWRGQQKYSLALSLWSRVQRNCTWLNRRLDTSCSNCSPSGMLCHISGLCVTVQEFGHGWLCTVCLALLKRKRLQDFCLFNFSFLFQHSQKLESREWVEEVLWGSCCSWWSEVSPKFNIKRFWCLSCCVHPCLGIAYWVPGAMPVPGTQGTPNMFRESYLSNSQIWGQKTTFWAVCEKGVRLLWTLASSSFSFCWLLLFFSLFHLLSNALKILLFRFIGC